MVEIFNQFIIEVFEFLETVIIIKKLVNSAIFAVQQVLD